jgi:hypothetical protein
MNIEQTKEAAAVMLAWADGKEIEYKEMALTGGWTTTENPQWRWKDFSYRIKPAATIRPWTADEVPLGAQARNREHPKTRWLIDRTSSEENRKDWCKNYEHSTDGGKTWSACGVVEEAK